MNNNNEWLACSEGTGTISALEKGNGEAYTNPPPCTLILRLLHRQRLGGEMQFECTGRWMGFGDICVSLTQSETQPVMPRTPNLGGKRAICRLQQSFCARRRVIFLVINDPHGCRGVLRRLGLSPLIRSRSALQYPYKKKSFKTGGIYAV